jgi:hypothetical protein
MRPRVAPLPYPQFQFFTWIAKSKIKTERFDCQQLYIMRVSAFIALSSLCSALAHAVALQPDRNDVEVFPYSLQAS